MASVCELTIGFGKNGNSLAFLGGGWAWSEDNFTWSVGPESHLVLPPLAAADDYVLTLDVIPFVHPPDLPNQRLIVSINGVVTGSTALHRPSLLGYRIPAELVRRSDRMAIVLQHPDATRPIDVSGSKDDRYLAFALLEAKIYRADHAARGHGICVPTGLMLDTTHERSLDAGRPMDPREWATIRTGLSIPELALQFESLGENCEFGLFQRRCDVEPLGLLRFSSTFMRNLIRGIDEKFTGLGDIEDIEPRLEGGARREFMIHEKKFGLVYHSFVHEGDRSQSLVREQEAARLKFLRRKLLEELEAADKIFVYKSGSGAAKEEILPLFMALTRDRAAILLWVVLAERHRPAGTVEVLMPGLLKGYIDRFAPEVDAKDLSFDGWLRICANAYALAQLRWLEPSAPATDFVHDRYRNGGRALRTDEPE